MITEQQLNIFIRIYKDRFGIELSRNKAQILAQKLLNLVQIFLNFDDIYKNI